MNLLIFMIPLWSHTNCVQDTLQISFTRNNSKIPTQICHQEDCKSNNDLGFAVQA